MYQALALSLNKRARIFDFLHLSAFQVNQQMHLKTIE
jgi:hypothetical protein